MFFDLDDLGIIEEVETIETIEADPITVVAGVLAVFGLGYLLYRAIDKGYSASVSRGDSQVSVGPRNHDHAA